MIGLKRYACLCNANRKVCDEVPDHLGQSDGGTVGSSCKNPVLYPEAKK